MDKNAKIIIWAVVLVAVVGGLYYFNKQDNISDDQDVIVEITEPVKIGAIVPLSGDATAYGIPIQRAAEIAISEINEAGGIGGQPIEIIWEDGKCEAKEATTAAQKLINVDGVKIIIGGVCSSEVLAIAPLAEENKVILISPSGTSPDITHAGDFTFRTAPSDALAGKVAAQYSYNTLGNRKAAIISENKDYTQGLRQIFSQSFSELGGEIVADEIFEPGAVDFASQILKVKSAEPDVIYLLPQAPTAGILLAKQLKQKAVAAQLLTAEVLLGRDVISENKENLEGIIGIEAYFNEEGETASQFLAAYEEIHDEKPPFAFFMASIHADFYLIKDAIENNGLDTEKIRDWLYDLSDWEGTSGTITFDENGDVATSYSIQQAKDGELVTLEIFTPTDTPVDDTDIQAEE